MVSENKRTSKSSKSTKSMLLGIGLDNKDGHVRVTNGDNFKLVGGSKETHEQMQEQAVKLNEKLSHRGKTLENVSRDEFIDLAREVGMKVIPDDLPK